MTEIEIKNKIDPLLDSLAINKNLDAAESIISELLKFLNVETYERKLLNIARVDSEIHRFQSAPPFLKQAAAFEIPNNKNNILDLKLYWLKKTTKTNLSWVVGLTPNFEDSLANDFENIGIDFVIPESADRLIILLSDRYKVRSLELKDYLRPTQVEIFLKWTLIDYKNFNEVNSIKEFFHLGLWDSFNFEPINRKFYFELVECFNILVIHLENSLGRKPSVMFTTRLIGRLLFVWFLKKKNLINTNYDYFTIDDIDDQTSFYKNKLELLFFDTLNRETIERKHPDTLTPYLNGGLFDINSNDFYNDQKLSFPVGFFNHLFALLNKYNFTVDESSSEFQHVAIDPEMLGRIFESLLAEQIDEVTGGDKKKSTGAFYTPREVVSFMCEQSIIEYLRNNVTYTEDRDQRIDELIKLPESIFRDQDKNKRRDWKPYKDEILSALNGSNKLNLTILDPAVGSGAFPIGMLQLLVKIYSRLDVKYEKNISTLKRDILSKTLYGVDINQTAIEITRLRAWLSIIVDIDDIQEIEPLPNLDFKFTCANTLIPLKEDKQFTLSYDSKFKEKLMDIRDRYFSSSNKKIKQNLQNEYIQLTHNDDLFDDSKTKQLKSYKPFDVGSSSDFYDPELHHGVNQFDIIIANPPYISEKDNANVFRPVNESSLGKTYHQGKMNFWFYFLHFSLNTLKPKGHIAFITSRYWINSQGAKKLINRIEKEASLVNVVDIGKLKVFDDVAGQHMIAIYTNAKVDKFKYKKIQTNIDEINNDISSENNSISYLRNADVFKNNEIIFSSQELIQNSNITIDDFYDISQGVVEASDKISNKQLKKISHSGDFKSGQGIFVLTDEEMNSLNLDTEEKSVLKKYLDAVDVHKWKISPSSKKWLIYSNSDVKSKILSNGKFINLRNHLDKFSPFITSSSKPYGIHRPRDIKYFNQPKIVFKGMFLNQEFAIDTNDYFLGMSFISIIQKNNEYSLEYLLGLLNSKYAFNWFNIYGKKRGAGVDIGVNKLRTFPLPKTHSKKLKDKVIEIISLPLSDLTTLENEIDSLVFKSYGLSFEEVKKIDSEFKLSVAEYEGLEIN